MKKETTAISTFFILFLLTGLISSATGMSSNNPAEIPLQVTSPVTMDGIISPGEYEAQVTIDAGSSFTLQYAIDGSTIYFAFSADVKGWISIGFGYSSKMQDSDIYIGYVDGSGAHMSDNWGTGTSRMQQTTSLLSEEAKQQRPQCLSLADSSTLETPPRTM